MTKRRRILHADKIIQNVIPLFCLLMYLQLKGYYSLSNNPLLLYTTTSDIRVANLSRLGKAIIIAKDLEQGSAVDFIFSKNYICWSDQTAELIQCMNYNESYSGEKKKIISESTPTGIAIDWYTDKIYWTDGEKNKIEVISIEQKHRKVLFWTEVDLARAIAVVPKEGLMFWTDWGEVPKIERAGMDGDPKSRRVIVKDDIIWPNGITVDYNNNLIYWVDAKLHFIDVIDFNGNKRRRVVKGEGLDYPYALTLFNNKFYWTDWTNWTISSWDMTTNGPIKELIKSEPVPVDVKIYDSSRQLLPTGDYPCKINNGGCSHLCLLSPSAPGYVCACPIGTMLMDGSNTTCYDTPQTMLVVAQRSMILKISLDSPDFTPDVLPLKDLKRALSVDFDPKTEFIYWADNLAKTISRARLDGSEQSVVIHSGGMPDSIAIDPLARNIYWTDPITDTINIARLDGTSKKVIIHEELYDPRAIAVHPTAGWMFWSDWNEKKPKIERANLDGTDRVLLVSERLTWPNGIALDTVNNKLYWGDARTHKIEVCNMDGTNRTELHNTDMLHIYGLTLLGQHLYWTDTQRRTLDRIHKDTGLDRQPVVEQIAHMMGVKAFRVGETLGTNPCVEGNGGCSHLCFNRPKDYVCSCPLGLELGMDRKTCSEPEAFLVYSRKNVIGHISIENENNDAVLPIKDLKEVSALEVHVSGSKIYWSDIKTKTINRCSVDGSNHERILEWVGLVEGLAIDWSGQNIYWTDTATQRIEMARLDGSSRKTLIWQGLKKPKSIVLDPKNGQMYWSELGSKTIKRAAMDGSAATALVEQAGRAHALALDYGRRALYWAALDPPAIERVTLDSPASAAASATATASARTLIAADLFMPYALTLYGDHLFWGDWNTGFVEMVKKSDGSGRRRVHTQLDYITDLKVYHRRRAAGSSQCDVDNGGCSHLCVPTHGSYRCACPTHYRLGRDNLTCAEPEEFLLFAQKNALGRIFVANGECNDAFIPLVGLRNVKAIEYDPVKKLLYWMDDDSHSIRRVPISYSTTSAITDSSVLVERLPRPFHMVLDVLGRALYWTCLDSDSINATSIDVNSSTGIIVRGENMMPRHLAFHQTKRVLVWNDVGLGAIMRANVDGTEREELARASNASALALDQATSIVYWAVNRQIHAIDLDTLNKSIVNGHVSVPYVITGNTHELKTFVLRHCIVYWAVNRQIHAIDLDTLNKRVIWQGGWVGTLSAYGGALYLSGGERALMRLPLHRRDAPAALVPHAARLAASVAVYPVATSHPCYGGRRCGGGAGACLANGACGGPRPACAADHYQCRLAGAGQRAHCVPRDWRCDGQRDCPDGSDEEACGACAGGVRCTDGSCADAVGGCARGAYCAHGPLPDAFRCDVKLCLSTALVCDGRQHCEDGSDEAPAFCAQKEPAGGVGGGGSRWSALGVCGAVAGCGGAMCGAWLLARRCRRRRSPPPRPPPAPPRHKPRATPLGASCTEASESLCERYPQPTANPPPSPATASGASSAAARRRGYRHYRASNRPPPPTPASTDACESEPEHVASAPPPSPAPLYLY